jgi:hypothetical protein
VCAYLLSYAEWFLWICTLNEDNKEKKSWWTQPHVGGEPHISCVVVALCIMVVM